MEERGAEVCLSRVKVGQEIEGGIKSITKLRPGVWRGGHEGPRRGASGGHPESAEGSPG